MSKYHPLDVRHPANRDRERNSYLLDPPDASTYALRNVTQTTQAPSRRGADYRGVVDDEPVVVPVLDLTSAAARPDANPWGGSNAPTPNMAPPLTRRRGSMTPKLIFFGIIAYLILNSMGLLDEIARFIARTGYELGLF